MGQVLSANRCTEENQAVDSKTYASREEADVATVAVCYHIEAISTGCPGPGDQPQCCRYAGSMVILTRPRERSRARVQMRPERMNVLPEAANIWLPPGLLRAPSCERVRVRLSCGNELLSRPGPLLEPH